MILWRKQIAFWLPIISDVCLFSFGIIYSWLSEEIQFGTAEKFSEPLSKVNCRTFIRVSEVMLPGKVFQI